MGYVRLGEVADILRESGWHVMADELTSVHDALHDALVDARAYRLGEAASVDDPDLDEEDRGFIERYDAALDTLGW